MHTVETGVGCSQSGLWRRPLHQETSARRLRCALRTSPWQLAPPTKRLGVCVPLKCSPGKPGSQAAFCISPRDKINAAPVDLLNAPFDLCAPSGIRSRILALVEAIDERVDQCSAGF